MSTAVAGPAPAVSAPPPAAEPAPGLWDRPRVELLAGLLVGLRSGERFSADGVTWAEYDRLLAVRDQYRAGVRLTYHHGELEAMSHGTPHERWKTILLGLLDMYLVGAKVPAVPCGNMTVRREDLAGGFEPDGCYYIRPSPAMLAVRQLDFAVDPPPDLAVEVEASRSVVGRLPVCAAFRVPEVWRFDGAAVTVLRLQPAGDYRPVPASVLLPGFPLADLPRYLKLAETVFYPELLDRFLTDVRAAPTPPPPETA